MKFVISSVFIFIGLIVGMFMANSENKQVRSSGVIVGYWVGYIVQIILNLKV